MTRRRRSLLDQIAYDAHEVSKYSGDLSALQRGGPARLAKRVARRRVTRGFFRALRGRGL